MFNQCRIGINISTPRFNRTKLPGYISGPPSCAQDNPESPVIPPPDENCIETDVEYAGYNIFKKTSSLDSLQDTKEKCQAACRNNTDCKWFNYRATDKNCFLKFKKGYKQYKKGMASGPPSCENVEPELDEKRLNKLCIERGKLPAAGAYKYENNIGASSGIVRVHSAANTIEECQELCRNTSGCVYFYFIFDEADECFIMSFYGDRDAYIAKWDTWSGPPSCESKNGQIQTEFTSDYDCGIKDIRYIGFAIPLNETAIIKSVDDCKKTCLATEKCVSFSYVEEKCYLTEAAVMKEYHKGAFAALKKDCI